MRNPFRANEDPALDDAIARLLIEMNAEPTNSPEYKECLKHIERLHKLRNKNRRPRVSPDAVIGTLGTILGIVVIVAYEQKHAMVSKGLGFVPKH